MKSSITLIILLTIISYPLYSQTVYEPLHSDVYSFLYKMAQKGIIEFDDQIKPVSRNYITQKLLEVQSNQSTAGSVLTEIEKEELGFYLKDFGIEREVLDVKRERPDVKVETTNEDGSKVSKSSMTILKKDPFGRLRLIFIQRFFIQNKRKPDIRI